MSILVLGGWRASRNAPGGESSDHVLDCLSNHKTFSNDEDEILKALSVPQKHEKQGYSRSSVEASISRLC